MLRRLQRYFDLWKTKRVFLWTAHIKAEEKDPGEQIFATLLPDLSYTFNITKVLPTSRYCDLRWRLKSLKWYQIVDSTDNYVVFAPVQNFEMPENLSQSHFKTNRKNKCSGNTDGASTPEWVELWKKLMWGLDMSFLLLFIKSWVNGEQTN